MVVGLDLEDTSVGSGCAWTKPHRVGFDFVGLLAEEFSGCWTAGGVCRLSGRNQSGEQSGGQSFDSCNSVSFDKPVRVHPIRKVKFSCSLYLALSYSVICS
jgi:hypothetical protein